MNYELWEQAEKAFRLMAFYEYYRRSEQKDNTLRFAYALEDSIRPITSEQKRQAIMQWYIETRRKNKNIRHKQGGGNGKLPKPPDRSCPYKAAGSDCRYWSRASSGWACNHNNAPPISEGRRPRWYGRDQPQTCRGFLTRSGNSGAVVRRRFTVSPPVSD